MWLFKNFNHIFITVTSTMKAKQTLTTALSDHKTDLLTAICNSYEQ